MFNEKKIEFQRVVVILFGVMIEKKQELSNERTPDISIVVLSSLPYLILKQSSVHQNSLRKGKEQLHI